LTGERNSTPQPNKGASFVRPLVKSDGWVDWHMPATQIERHVRAMDPWPRAWTTLSDGTKLQIFESNVVTLIQGEPGTVDVVGKNVVVACGEGAIRLGFVQLAGGARTAAIDLVQGRKLKACELLGRTGAPERTVPLIVPLDS